MNPPNIYIVRALGQGTVLLGWTPVGSRYVHVDPYWCGCGSCTSCLAWDNAPLPSSKQLSKSAQRVAEIIRLSCPGYDSKHRKWAAPELALWWAVFERAVLDTCKCNSAAANTRNTAAEAVDWFWTKGAVGVYETLGLNDEYVQKIMARWLNAAYPEVVYGR